MNYFLIFLICIVAISSFDAFGENVQVGVIKFENFEMLYMISDGTVTKIVPNNQIDGFDIHYRANSDDSFLELIIPTHIFQSSIFEILDDFDYETETESFGLSSYGDNFLSHVTYIYKGSGFTQIGLIKDQYLDQYSQIIKITSVQDFENDMYKRAEQSKNTENSIKYGKTAIENFFLGDGNEEKIFQDLNKSIQADPENIGSWDLKMDFLIFSERYTEAFSFAEEFENKFGYDGLLEKKAKIMLLTGNANFAVDVYETILNQTRDIYRLNEFVQILVENNEIEKAKSLIYDFHNKNSKYYDENDIGIVFSNAWLDWDAITYFNRMLEKDPKNFESLVYIANSYNFLGDFEKSNYYAKLALEEEPTNEYLFALIGDNYYYQDKTSESIIPFLTAIELNPDYEYAYESLGYSYLALNNNDKAIEYFNKVQEMNPTYADYYYGKSLALSQEGNFKEAQNELLKAIELEPYNDEYFVEISRIMFNQKKLAESMDYALIAIKVNPHNASAYDMLGKIYLENKNYPKALESFEASLQLFPDDEEIISLKNFAQEKISSGSMETTKITNNSQNGGGCLIATATFDSELAPQVQKLREIRDSKFLSTESGSQFMESFNSFYYSFSPIIADYERENPIFKEIVKIGITPLLSTLSLMDYADTESEVLGIGISLIILNAMMYVGLPVFGIMIARKRF